VSAICALNMNLFYGIGMGWGWAVPRTLTPIDLSVLLAAVNLGVLGWSARVLVRRPRSRSARLTRPSGPDGPGHAEPVSSRRGTARQR